MAHVQNLTVRLIGNHEHTEHSTSMKLSTRKESDKTEKPSSSRSTAKETDKEVRERNTENLNRESGRV